MKAKSRLKIIREERNITLSEVAKYANIGISRYFMIESGGRLASPELLPYKTDVWYDIDIVRWKEGLSMKLVPILDSTSFKVLRLKEVNPRLTATEIAPKTNIPVDLVKNQLDRLKSAGFWDSFYNLMVQNKEDNRKAKLNIVKGN